MPLDPLDHERLESLVHERDTAAGEANCRDAYLQGRIDEYCGQNAIEVVHGGLPSRGPQAMMHSARVHRVTDVPDDEIDQLAERLQSIVHTSCSGYRWRGLLILNDATGENGAQEYAIVREATSRQIESLTCSWYADAADLAGTLARLADDAHWPDGENSGNSHHVTVHLEHPAEPCRLCA